MTFIQKQMEVAMLNETIERLRVVILHHLSTNSLCSIYVKKAKLQLKVELIMLKLMLFRKDLVHLLKLKKQLLLKRLKPKFLRILARLIILSKKLMTLKVL